VTDRPNRLRAAREIAADVVRLTRAASHIIDIEPATIADLRSDPGRVETLLRQLVAGLSAESERDELCLHTSVKVAADALGLLEEWRHVQRRDIAHRREVLTQSLIRLRALSTEDELFDQLCQEACRGCGAGRALVARVETGSWIPWRQFDTAPSRTLAPAWPGSAAEGLVMPGVESTVIMSRQSTRLAGGGHPAPPGPVRDLMRRSSFVIAPIAVGDDVVGLLYAAEPSTTPEGRPDLAGRLHTFAASVGQLLQRAATFAHVEAQSAYLWKALSDAELAVTGFDTNVDLVQLVGREQSGPTPAGAAPWTSHPSVLDRSFTAREREVLALVARGLDNTRIAAQLAIATNTVKYHLQNMLRKAGAVNRTELIAQFYGSEALRSDAGRQ
jgi:DNA-binding CsgD family transcriptional regulator